VVFIDQRLIMADSALPRSGSVTGMMLSEIVAVVTIQTVVHDPRILRMAIGTTQSQGMMPAAKICAMTTPAIHLVSQLIDRVVHAESLGNKVSRPSKRRHHAKTGKKEHYS
jgi:hypothetical protein